MQLVLPFSASWLIDSDIHQARAWLLVVRTLPFPLDLHAMLRRRVAKAGISSRQGILSLFAEHLQFYSSFFVGRSMRGRIRVAARKHIDRTFGRVHGHIQLSVVDAICDQRAHAYMASAGREFDQAPAFDPPLFS